MRQDKVLCEICKTENSKFDVKCRNCGSFLQNPVRVLNFFETFQNLLLNPSATFHRIIIAERKNYALLLSSLTGIAIAFDIFYFIKIGERFEVLLYVIFYAIIVGVLIGIVLFLTLSLFVYLSLISLKARLKFKSTFAVLVYASSPIALSLFFFLPSMLAVWGIYFFTEQPLPHRLKPFEFYITAGIWFILRLSFFVLLYLALKQILENFKKAFFLALLTSTFALILLTFIARSLTLFQVF